MRRVSGLPAVLAVLAVVSCTPVHVPPPPADVVADGTSAFVIADGAGLYGLDGQTLTYRTSLPLGEKLALVGTTASVTQSGQRRSFLAVKDAAGALGWMRADLLASRVVLAAVVDDEVPILTLPAEGAQTGATIPRGVVLAIDMATAGTPFLRVTGYDPSAKRSLTGAWIPNAGTSSQSVDVAAAVLLRLAAASDNATQRRAFLSSAQKDYPTSVFAPDVKAALDALNAPPPPTPADTATDSSSSS